MSPEKDERPEPIENELDAEEDQRDFGNAIEGLASITPYQVWRITHRQVKVSPDNRESTIWRTPVGFLELFLRVDFKFRALLIL